MTPARPTAILFDLWGTLVPPRPDRRDVVSHLMAADLGVGGDEFAAAVRDSHAERFLGRMARSPRHCASWRGAAAETPRRPRSSGPRPDAST